MVGSGIIEAFQLQAIWCRRLHSELYARLLERATEDIAAGGPVAQLVASWSGNPMPDALPLRVMGAVHDLVLRELVPDLARFYPSVGGRPEWPAVWDAFAEVVTLQMEVLRPRLLQPVQTNEVSRCAALLGGFLRVASQTGLPLRLLEIGTSAGLNLLWDRYRYELGSHRWGDPQSPVVIPAAWDGPIPELTSLVEVASREGCDIAPIDITHRDQARLLESFVWADQTDRLSQLRSAVALARQEPPRLDRVPAAGWLGNKLFDDNSGTATVVFHSILWWYLSETERNAVTELIERAGIRATKKAPLAWLQMEILTSEGADVRLRTWPGGESTLLAHADPHGRRVTWRSD